jgi:hypothetical protein
MKSEPRVDGVLGDESDSQLLKLGWAALKRINSQDAAERPLSNSETMLGTLVSPDLKRPFSLLVSLMFHFTWGRLQPYWEGRMAEENDDKCWSR